MLPGTWRIIIGVAFVIAGAAFMAVDDVWIGYFVFILIGLFFVASGGNTAYKAKRIVDEHRRRNPDPS